ncbi:MAG: ABC transporter permease subunit [Propionibacteriales bacterium]|nr:ABC transporter permease subunit [Propionibacteriales bacterium]
MTVTTTRPAPAAGPPSRPPRTLTSVGRRLRSRSLSLFLLLVVGLLVLPPVVILVMSAFADGRTLRYSEFTWENFADVLTDEHAWMSIKDTVIFGVGAALTVVTVATILAWLVERTNTPGRRAVYALLIISFAVPTFIQGMGWLLFLGPGTGLFNSVVQGLTGSDFEFPIYTMGSMIFVQAMTMLPVIFLLIVPAMRSADPGLEEAAAMSGASRVQTILKITLPLIRPAVLAALFLSAILTIESFEVPALIGSPARITVLSTEIFAEIRSGVADYGAASAFSIIMMIITIAGLINYQRATARSHRYATVRGKAYRPSRVDLGRWKYVAAVFAVGVPLLKVSPVLMIVWASFLERYKPPSLSAFGDLTTATYAAVARDPEVVRSLINSVVLGAGAAVAVMVLAGLAAWQLVRRRNNVTKSLDFIMALPLVMPGLVLGLAVLRTSLTIPIGLYGTEYIILIALVIHYLPYGMRYGHAGVISLHPELEEAASVAGANPTSVVRRILVPLLWPTLIAGGAFVFLATIRQLSLVVFLSGPGYEVATPVLFLRWQYGSITDAAAFALIIVAVACLVLASFSKLTAGMAIANPGANRATPKSK